MAITKRNIIGEISIDELFNISVRTDTIVEEDNLELHRTYHREVLTPGTDLTGKDSQIIQISELFWTEEVIESALNRLVLPTFN